MWSKDKLNELVETLANLPERLGEVLTRLHGEGPRGPGQSDDLLERRRRVLDLDHLRLLTLDNRALLEHTRNLRADTVALRDFGAMLRRVEGSLSGLGRGRPPGGGGGGGGPPLGPPPGPPPGTGGGKGGGGGIGAPTLLMSQALAGAVAAGILRRSPSPGGPQGPGREPPRSGPAPEPPLGPPPVPVGPRPPSQPPEAEGPYVPGWEPTVPSQWPPPEPAPPEPPARVRRRPRRGFYNPEVPEPTAEEPPVPLAEPPGKPTRKRRKPKNVKGGAAEEASPEPTTTPEQVQAPAEEAVDIPPEPVGPPLDRTKMTTIAREIFLNLMGRKRALGTKVAAADVEQARGLLDLSGAEGQGLLQQLQGQVGSGTFTLDMDRAFRQHFGFAPWSPPETGRDLVRGMLGAKLGDLTFGENLQGLAEQVFGEQGQLPHAEMLAKLRERYGQRFSRGLTMEVAREVDPFMISGFPPAWSQGLSEEELMGPHGPLTLPEPHPGPPEPPAPPELPKPKPTFTPPADVVTFLSGMEANSKAGRTLTKDLLGQAERLMAGDEGLKDTLQALRGAAGKRVSKSLYETTSLALARKFLGGGEGEDTDWFRRTGTLGAFLFPPINLRGLLNALSPPQQGDPKGWDGVRAQLDRLGGAGLSGLLTQVGKLGATAGPIAAAATALAGLAAAAAVAPTRMTDFAKKTLDGYRDLAQVSGNISGTLAQFDSREVLRQVRVAASLAPDIAKLAEATDRAAEATLPHRVFQERLGAAASTFWAGLGSGMGDATAPLFSALDSQVGAANQTGFLELLGRQLGRNMFRGGDPQKMLQDFAKDLAQMQQGAGMGAGTPLDEFLERVMQHHTKPLRPHRP